MASQKPFSNFEIRILVAKNVFQTSKLAFGKKNPDFELLERSFFLLKTKLLSLTDQMDPEALIQTFSTIVGLLCNFRQERGGRKELSHRDFIEWLEYHRHEEIKNIIVRTHNLPREIDEFLRKDQKVILEKLEGLDTILASILSRLDGFTGITSVLAPGIEISEQAKTILVDFVESEADMLILMGCSGQDILLFSPGSGRNVKEPRFLQDDIKTLHAFGFLTLDSYSGSDPIYKLTRSGAKYAKLLKS